MSEHPFNEIFSKVKEEKKRLTELFAFYIKDRSIPLETRWEAFMNAPEEFSQSGGWIVRFDSFKPLCHGRKNPIEDKLYRHMNRNETVRTLDIYERFTEGSEDWDDEEVEEMMKDGAESYYYDVPGFTKEILEAWQEEVLSKNLKSFEYDW